MLLLIHAWIALLDGTRHLYSSQRRSKVKKNAEKILAHCWFVWGQINSLTLEKCCCNLRSIIFKLISRIDTLSILWNRPQLSGECRETALMIQTCEIFRGIFSPIDLQGQKNVSVHWTLNQSKNIITRFLKILPVRTDNTKLLSVLCVFVSHWLME